MSHEVESLAYVSNEENGRFVPWHGLGTPVEEAMTSEEAIKKAGLDWIIQPRPIYIHTENGELEVEGVKANTRNTDDRVMGVVSDRYKIVQNKDAFDFTDVLIGEGCRYETAGSLFGGKKVFLLARMPQQKILGDDFDQYLCFTNSHDGFGAIQVCCTNVRVVCNNTLNLALDGTARKWSCRHVGDIQSKMAEAHKTLKLATDYNANFAKFAERAANVRVTEAEAEDMMKKLFPERPEMTQRSIDSLERQKEQFRNCMVTVDLTPFYGTLWGFVNAASDFHYHKQPGRMTSTYAEGKTNEAFSGSNFMDKVMQLCPANIMD